MRCAERKGAHIIDCMDTRLRQGVFKRATQLKDLGQLQITNRQRVVDELPQDLMTRGGHISIENGMKFATPVPNVGGSLDNPFSQDFPHFILDLSIRFSLDSEVLGDFFRVKLPL